MHIIVFFLRSIKSNLSSQLSWALLIVLLTGFSLGRPLLAQQAQTNDTQPSARVVSAGLNVRAGPGLGFTIIGYVRYGDVLPIIGQAAQCRWLLVRTANASEGWISGKPAYTTVNGECDAIDSTVVNESKVATQAPTQSTVESAVPPAGQGCYLLQNRLGPQITVTFTNRENGKSVQVSVPHGAEVAHCMVAGEYTYTVSAVGFRDRNGELKIIAGDAYMLPIGAQ